jgi:general secretion pathway protein F
VPRFRYRALRATGGEIAGELVAESAREAATRLQAVGDYPIEISLFESGAPSRRRLTASGARLSARDLVLFTRQLATLLSAGVALDRDLSLVAAAQGSPRRARLANELLAAVNRGETLSRACREHPALPPHYSMVVAAGEAKGDIADALQRLATVLERRRQTARALFGALIYPISVLVVAGISVSFLLAFVVPQFAGLLASFRHDPPLAMRVLLTLSDWFQVVGPPLAVLLVALAAWIVFRRRDPEFRAAFDLRLLRFPGLGLLLGKIEAERLAFLLGNLVAAGVTLPEAVAAAAAAATNAAYRAGLATARQAIERGDLLTTALAASALLPELAVELVRVGEETGDLATMLLKASDILARETEATTSELIALVTPVSIVLLGLLIGAVAYALLGTVLEVYDFAA